MKRDRSVDSQASPALKKRKAIRWDTSEENKEDAVSGSATTTATQTARHTRSHKKMKLSTPPPASTSCAEADPHAPKGTARDGEAATSLNAQRETLSAAQAAAQSAASTHLSEVIQLAMFDTMAVAKVVDGATPTWNTLYMPSLRRTA